MAKKNQKLQIGILGAGSWGTILAMLAAKNCERVFLYSREKKIISDINNNHQNSSYYPNLKLSNQICATDDLNLLFSRCELIVPVVPAVYMRELARLIAKLVKPSHTLIHASKGLEPKTSKRMSVILKEQTKSKRIGALSGPNLASEIASGLPAATVIASPTRNVIEIGQSAFHSELFRVYGNTDIVGVEWLGSLKNVLAIASGVVHALGIGQNATAMLLTRGIAEMRTFISAMGGNPATLLSLAGIGDLFATCTSHHSRNFQAGNLLGQGKQVSYILNHVNGTVEGLNTIRETLMLAKKNKIQMPITTALHQVAFENKPVVRAIKELMNRPTKDEL